MDVRYDAADKVLLAATLGRGAWTIPNADQTLGVDPVLNITGRDSNTNRDVIWLVRDGIKPWLVKVLLDGSSTPSATFDLSSFSKIKIDGNDGDDIFQIDRTHGPIVVNDTIAIDGGAGTNDLELINVGDTDSLPGDAKQDFINANQWNVSGQDRFHTHTFHSITLTNVVPPPH